MFEDSWNFWVDQARLGRDRSRMLAESSALPQQAEEEEPLGKILSGDGNKPAEPQGSPEEGDGHGNPAG
ncbi:MAG: hypothetical protein HYV32_06530 [Candidatus Kerfeldbacteria bacterium]|nr:hypothetical protein [Candidatus Kerfeldbacteria bacterium]